MCYNALFVYENEHGNSSAKGLLIYKYEVVLPVFFVVRRVLYAYWMTYNDVILIQSIWLPIAYNVSNIDLVSFCVSYSCYMV